MDDHDDDHDDGMDDHDDDHDDHDDDMDGDMGDDFDMGLPTPMSVSQRTSTQRPQCSNLA